MMPALITKIVDFLSDGGKESTVPSTNDRFNTGEEAWSEESTIYSGSDFEKYNPDNLIGTKGYGIYKRMMLDEQVKAVVKFKRDAITARDWYFCLETDKLSEEEKKKRINIFTLIVEKMKGSWMDNLNGVMSALYNGFSMTEKVYGFVQYENLNWWGIEKLKLKPFDTFYFYPDEFGEVQRLVQKLGGKEKELDLGKFIHYVMNPDIDEHYGQSELREAYRAWFSKDIIIKFHNMWLERHAGGFRWIQAEKGKTLNAGDPNFTKIQNVLNNIQTSTGIILPSGYSINSEYPSNNVAFKEAINDNDTAIARALLVPNLLGVSPQGDVGSYAQSTNQLEAFMWTLETDAARLEECLNEQLFRELGEANFGDDNWPKFKFKPATGSKKLEIIRTWRELVAGNAVRATEADESHLRELLEFPPPSEEINSLPEIEEKEEGSPENEVPENEAPENKKDVEEVEPVEKDEGEKKKNSIDETIWGWDQVKISAFTKALKRVEFKIIDKTTESLVDEYRMMVAKHVDIVVEDLVSKMSEKGEVDTEVSSNIKALKVEPKLKARLNKIITDSLKEAHNLGVRHAAFEIDKAESKIFSKDICTKKVAMAAKDFLKATAFKVTGDILSKAVSTVEQAIIRGSKLGKELKDIRKDIDEDLIRKGLASEEKLSNFSKVFVIDDPDEHVPDHWITTAIRTISFEAVNNARHEYFSDEALDGFVLGYEYSAILDSRTTEICKHLDSESGKAGTQTLKWYEDNPGFRPPNHFNCRSLLVPVTKEDTPVFESGPAPRLSPQQGFGG